MDLDVINCNREVASIFVHVQLVNVSIKQVFSAWRC